MNTVKHLNLATALLCVQLLFTSQQSWGQNACLEYYGGLAPLSLNFERTVYIDQTAKQSRVKAIAQTVFTGATALQLGTPTMLRGIDLKEIFWIRDGHLLLGMPRAYGEGSSPWGAMEISTQNGDANVLSITINPTAGYRMLSEKKRALLQLLFPNLEISTSGETNLGTSGHEKVPDKIHLTLRRSQMNVSESFEASARSLLNTLLNDPNGLMGINPKTAVVKYQLPPKLKENDIVNQNLDFFGNFGQWGTLNGRWFAYNRRAQGDLATPLLSTAIHIDVQTKAVSFWLENASTRHAVVANIRRIAYALVQSEFSQTNLPLPRAEVSGINGVSLRMSQLSEAIVPFLKHLDRTQNDAHFEAPLANLTDAQRRLISDWLVRYFNQSTIPAWTSPIRAEEIFE